MDIEEIKTIKQSRVIILGSFNPAIIHPEWLDRNQVLPPTEVRGITEAKKEWERDLEGIKVASVSSNVFVSGSQTILSLPSYRIFVTPDKFDATTLKREKHNELCRFVASTFKILEHTPVKAMGINFISSLRFSEHAGDLMHRYFCAEPKALTSIFGEHYLIDSSVRYDYKDFKVTVRLGLREKKDEIGIDFNYHMELTEKEGTKELIDNLLENFKPTMLNADKVIRGLFGEPVDGVENNDKSGKNKNV
ncbi:MAG: hypothetical protein ABIN18_08030 [Pseudomonadota bacterium]